MANDPTTTAREFPSGKDLPSRPSLTDWLVRDLRIARSTERPAPPAISRDEEQVTVAAPAEEEAAEPEAPDVEFERYEPIQVEAIDGGVDLPVATSALVAGAAVAGAAVAGVSHEVLPPPPEADEPEAVGSAEPAASAESTEAADAASHVAMSPPGDWLEEDEMGAAGAFFSSNADFDEGDESAPVTDETIGSSLSPHVLAEEEEEEETAAPLMVAGVGGGSSRWKTIAAIAAAVLLVSLFGQRLAKRHAQATASAPLPVATIPPKAPTVEGPREESSAEAEGILATDETKDGKRSSGLGGGRAHAGPDSPSDPAIPGGPSVARFPDLPREILNQLEQVFESESGQRNKSASDSIERYSR